MEFLVGIFWYTVACLVVLFELILFVSVVFIPVMLYLRLSFRWFRHPFDEATEAILDSWWV